MTIKLKSGRKVVIFFFQGTTLRDEDGKEGQVEQDGLGILEE